MESRQEGSPYQQLPGTVEPALCPPLHFPLLHPVPPSPHIPNQNNLEGCGKPAGPAACTGISNSMNKLQCPLMGIFIILYVHERENFITF